MTKYKKVLLIGLVSVLIIGATLGTVMVAQADDTAVSANTTMNIWDRVAAIFKQNTGTEINSADLKTAFEQAHKDLATERQQTMKERVALSTEDRLKKMLDEGKITQAQFDAIKAWLAAKPSTMISDAYKQWLESRPNALTDEFKAWLEARPEGLPGMPGLRDGQMKRVMPRIGNMFGGFCAPDTAK
jgi:hypothetical protein